MDRTLTVEEAAQSMIEYESPVTQIQIQQLWRYIFYIITNSKTKYQGPLTVGKTIKLMIKTTKMKKILAPIKI